MPYWDPDRRNQWVTIAEYAFLQPAISDRMLLESAGIEALIADEHLARIAGPYHLVFGGRIRLQVAESDAADALRILNTPVSENPGNSTV